VRFGFLVVARFDAVFLVAPRAVILLGFAFLDDDFFVLETFFVEVFFFGAAAARFAFRLRGFLVRFLAAPIAAPEGANHGSDDRNTQRSPGHRARDGATERASHRTFFCVSGVFFLFLFVHDLPLS
jgi:hypothetical protein